MSTTPHRIKLGTCRKCSGWTEHGGKKLCADCSRPEVVMNKCEWLGCVSTFKRKGSAKYCIEHRGLKPSGISMISE